MKTVTEPTKRISAMPEDDLDELREAAVTATGRLLGALHARHARKRGELQELEIEIAAIEGMVSGAAAPAALPSTADRHYLDGPLPNGFHAELPGQEPIRPRGQNPAMAEAVDVQAPQPTDAELRETAIGKLFESLDPKIAERLGNDCEDVKVETIGDLVQVMVIGDAQGPMTFEDFLTVEHEAEFFRIQLRLFFQRAGYAAANLAPDGLPKAWMTEPEPDTGTVVRDALKGAIKPDTGTVAGTEARDEGAKKAKSKKTPIPPPPDGFNSWCDLHAAEQKPAPTAPAADLTGVRPPRPSRPPSMMMPQLEQNLRVALDPMSYLWSQLQNRGADGITVRKAIAQRFREHIGKNGPGWSCDGADDRPKFWNTDGGYKSKKKATLQGGDLVEAVRWLLDIPEPF